MASRRGDVTRERPDRVFGPLEQSAEQVKPRVIYVVHDIHDAAVRRRARMLRLGGAQLDNLTGFRREAAAPAELDGVPITHLGQTFDARLTARAFSVLVALMRSWTAGRNLREPTLIIARNIESLVLGRAIQLGAGRRRARLVYELLDVHTRLSGTSWGSRLLRVLEARLLRSSSAVILSSPAFEREHLAQHYAQYPPCILVENKLFGASVAPASRSPGSEDVIRIGWHGVLRCRRSLLELVSLASRADGRIRVEIRGKVASSSIPDFDELIADQPHVRFHGAYVSPDDLARIYAGIDLIWAIDFYEEGKNSLWLLPNRLYEACRFSVVPVALHGTQTGAWLREFGAGVLLADTQEHVVDALARLSREQLHQLRSRVEAIPAPAVETTLQECHELVETLTRLAFHPSPDGAGQIRPAVISTEH